MKTINMNNTNKKNPAADAYYAEFLRTINLTNGDELDNLEILSSWPVELVMNYYNECASLPERERRSPWQVVLDSYCEKVLQGKVHEVFYNITDQMPPVAVIATKRMKNGEIDPRTIHTIVHFTPREIMGYDIDNLNAYGKIIEDTYGKLPRLVMIGNELTDNAMKAFSRNGRDVSVIVHSYKKKN